MNNILEWPTKDYIEESSLETWSCLHNLNGWEEKPKKIQA